MNPATSSEYACTKEAETVIKSIEEPVGTWMTTYLKEWTSQLKTLIGSYNWTVTDTYYAQSLCPYGTVGLGYSSFCQLSTCKDWENYVYLIEIEFAALSGSLSPTGRAQDIA